VRRSWWLAVFVATSAGAQAPYRLWPGPVSDSTYAVTIDSAVPMRARDGVVLMSYVARPVGRGPFPVVLSRTPYGRTAPDQGRFWASRGYIYVRQDVRGRYGSQGTFHDASSEDVDGYDAVEWAAALPGSTGRVGMIGASYGGKVQWYAAVARPPHLAAIVPTVSPPDPWRNVPYWNMTFAVSMVAWSCLVSGRVNQDLSNLDMARWMRLLPVAAVPDSLHCPRSEVWTDWMGHPTLDAFWRRIGYEARVPGVRVPALGISGWYDDDGNGTTTNFVALASTAGHPYERMIIGPWSHGGTPRLLHQDFGPAAVVDHALLELRWLDHYLKGVPNGVDTEPPVTLFIMGDNVWRAEHEWPLARTRWTRFYLHSRNRLDTLPPALAERADRYKYDPRDPTPYIVDARELELNLDEDYATIEARRRDLVVYTTAALDRPLEITGPISVTLWAATDARDTDWHAMLLDVTPDGHVRRIQDGIVRARFRDGLSTEHFPLRGVPMRYTIDLWQTGLVLPPGHRLRVAIASAAFPKYDRNLNTGANNEHGTTSAVAHQRILHDGAHASYIMLPVIPR
jgi:uncharacterized protein